MTKLIWILFIGLPFSVFSQATTFKKVISDSLANDIARGVVEDANGNFIFAGYLQNPLFGHGEGYLVKMDSNGNVLKTKVLSNTLSTFISSIHIVNNEYYFIGSNKDIINSVAQVTYLKTDTNFNTLVSKSITVPNNLDVAKLTSFIDSDTNFVITAALSPFSGLFPFTPFLYKSSLLGDSIAAKVETFPSYNASNSPETLFSIEKQDSSGYITFAKDLLVPSGINGSMIHYDKNFNLLQVDTIIPKVSTDFSPVRVNNNIVIAGRRRDASPQNFDIQIVVLTDSNQVLFADTIGVPTNDKNLPALIKNVSAYNNNIFIGTTQNASFIGPFGGGNPSWFHITKVNPDLSKVWSKTFGGDFYYLMYGILATKDGGCLAFGTKYDENNPGNQTDLYVIKIDGNGLITFTQEIDLDKINVSVYPNPGVNELNINSDIKEGRVELYSIDGRQLLTQKANNNPINTSSLPSGVYIYKIFDTSTLVKSGKWVKK